MNLLNINDRFPNKKSCRDYLRLSREEEGIICNGNDKHYRIIFHLLIIQ